MVEVGDGCVECFFGGECVEVQFVDQVVGEWMFGLGCVCLGEEFGVECCGGFMYVVGLVV